MGQAPCMLIDILTLNEQSMKKMQDPVLHLTLFER